MATETAVALDSNFKLLLMSRILVAVEKMVASCYNRDQTWLCVYCWCQTPSGVVSPRGNHSGCALVIARRGETTPSGVWHQQYTHNHVWSLNRNPTNPNPTTRNSTNPNPTNRNPTNTNTTSTNPTSTNPTNTNRTKKPNQNQPIKPTKPICAKTQTIQHQTPNQTSCAHKWGQYTPALISTHPIKKYPTNSPIFKSLWSKIDRDPETYPISINPRDEMNRADSFREKLRKPRFSVNFWPPEGQKWGHEHENR